MSTSALLHFTDSGTGPPLVLIHGLNVSGKMFEDVVGRFAERHRVLVPDLRGHGRSRSMPPPYTVEQLAADVAVLLDQLGIASAAIAGYSQGGAVAQQFALDYPKRCERLVLACTYAYNMATRREWIEGHVAPLMIRVLGPRRLAKLAMSQGAKELDKSRADWLIDLMGEQDRRLMVAAWKETMAFDGRARLKDIECPTLVIAAANDRAIPAHHAVQLHNGIAASRLAVVEGAGHTLIWTHPDDFVRLTEGFLADS